MLKVYIVLELWSTEYGVQYGRYYINHVQLIPCFPMGYRKSGKWQRH